MVELPNGWNRHEKLVLDALVRIERKVDDQAEAMVKMRVEIAMLKVKSGLWGAAAGFLPALIVMGAIFVRGI